MQSPLQNIYEPNREEDSLSFSLPIYRNKRNPSAIKIFLELIKKQFLVRFRSLASLIEIFFSFVFFLVVVLADKVSSQIVPSNLNPTPVFETIPIPLDIAYFFLSSNMTPVIAGPNTIPVMSLMNHLYSSFLRYTPLKIEYVDDESEIIKRIEKLDVNGFGIYWENSNKEDFLSNPIIRTYSQCVNSCPTYTLLREIRSYFTNELMKIDPNNEELNKLVFINSSLQMFAYPSFRKCKLRTQLPLMFIGSVIILATMPDLEILANEKFTKLLPLYSLMGCSETAYYLSFYFVAFLGSMITNLAMSLFYCFYYFMTGVSFSLYFTINCLFALSYLSLSLFILTLFRNAKFSRLYPSFMFIFNIASTLIVSYNFDKYWPLTISSSKLFSLVPQFTYLLIISSLRLNSLYTNKHINWSNVAEPVLGYNNSFGLASLAIDAVLYLILFIIAHAIFKYSSFIKNKLKSLFKHQNPQNFQNSFNDNDAILYDINDNNSNNNFFIRVTGLSKLYQQTNKKNNIINSTDEQDKRALKSISFDVKKNEIIVVTGPNGAGKTTLINILSGVIKPSCGNLDFNQNNLEIEKENIGFSLNQSKGLKPTSLEKEDDNSLSDYLLNSTNNFTNGEFSPSNCFRTDDFSLLQPYLGVVFQENVFVSYLSVNENLKLFGTLRGISKQDIDTFIDFFSNTLQMKDSLYKLAKDLSGGQKRKLCLAISLIGSPSILLLDEPTSGVDVQGRQLIWKLISSLSTTSIITTHGLEEAEAASSRIFLINKGNIPFKGNSAELREKFNCGYMIKFHRGSSAAYAALRVIQDEVLIQKNLNPDMAKIKHDFLDTIYIPICPEVTDCLTEIEKKKDELNIGDYSIFIEQIEDLILRTE